MSFVYIRLDLIGDENGDDSLRRFLLFLGSTCFLRALSKWMNKYVERFNGKYQFEPAALDG